MIKKPGICVLCLIMHLTLVAAVFAGGEGEVSADQQSGPPGKTVITYTRWAGTREARDFQVLLTTFMKLHPDIIVKPEFLPWAAYWEKLKTAILGGEAPDVISLSQKEASPYITKGAFLALDEIEGAAARLDEMHAGTKEAVTYKGKIYAMPVGIGVRAIIYNKELFDQAGIPYPDRVKPMSWEQFMKIGKKLTKVEGEEVVQYAAHLFKQEMWEAFVNQMGGKLMDNYIRPTKMLINTPEGIAGLKLMVDLIDQKIIPPFSGDWAGPWGTPDAAIITGRVAMMHTGPWGLGVVEEANIKYGTAPLPMGKKRANRGYINSLAIYRYSKNVDAAWTFIKWMTSAAGQLEFTKTGDLPANKNALEQARVNNTRPPEVMDAFFSELPYVVTGPMLPTNELEAILDDTTTLCFQGRLSPEETAVTLEREGNDLIAELNED